jgi:hypothetical protein
MDRRYLAAGVVAASAAGALWLLGSSKTASAAGRTWQRVPIDADRRVYQLLKGFTYGVSDLTRGQTVAYEPVSQSLSAHGLRTLQVTADPPAGWPADDATPGKAYLIFTPEQDMEVSQAFLSSDQAHLFVLS